MASSAPFCSPTNSLNQSLKLKADTMQGQSTNGSILLINMFSGTYSDWNIGHEAMNFFRADDDASYLYVPRNGRPSKEHEDVGKVLMLLHFGGGRHMVLGRALIEGTFDDDPNFQNELFETITYAGFPLSAIFEKPQEPMVSPVENVTFKASRCEIAQGLLRVDCTDGNVAASNDDLTVHLDMTQSDRDRIFGHHRAYIYPHESLYAPLDGLFEESAAVPFAPVAPIDEAFLDGYRSGTATGNPVSSLLEIIASLPLAERNSANAKRLEAGIDRFLTSIHKLLR